ncbi:hypothetical protein G4B88_016278 [Cannabis sativa]|uniref:NB-ARC domain-containing protein n=1 Tax=Cannabis sativa TaxID=3483 RepID=A0A7J6GLQ1_CANSA|nr:hypothetical protein G4B88_016278 [Cannabis sativa]
MERLVEPKIIHGFEEHLATLERLVVQQKSDEDDEFKAIAIVKTKGISKTSLYTVVFDNEKVKKRFLPRVWVSMPTPSDEIQKEPQESDSQTDLILARSRTRENHGLKGLICALRQELRKRYLIVLDQWYGDLSSSEGYSLDLVHGFPKGYGGTMIVTRTTEILIWKSTITIGRLTIIELLKLLGLIGNADKEKGDLTIFSRNELSIPVIPLEKLGCNMRIKSRLQESILLKEIESQFQSIENTLGNSRAVIAYGF